MKHISSKEQIRKIKIFSKRFSKNEKIYNFVNKNLRIRTQEERFIAQNRDSKPYYTFFPYFMKLKSGYLLEVRVSQKYSFTWKNRKEYRKNFEMIAKGDNMYSKTIFKKYMSEEIKHKNIPQGEIPSIENDMEVSMDSGRFTREYHDSMEKSLGDIPKYYSDYSIIVKNLPDQDLMSYNQARLFILKNIIPKSYNITKKIKDAYNTTKAQYIKQKLGVNKSDIDLYNIFDNSMSQSSGNGFIPMFNNENNTGLTSRISTRS